MQISNYNPPEKKIGFLRVTRFLRFPGIPGMPGSPESRVQRVRGFQGCQDSRDARDAKDSMAKMENSHRIDPDPSKMHVRPTKIIRIKFRIDFKR